MNDDPFKRWTQKDYEEALRPKMLGNFGLAILPAAYAWQLYGWAMALVVWFVVATILAAFGWGMVLGKIRPVLLWWLKAAVVLISFLVLGISAMEAGQL